MIENRSSEIYERSIRVFSQLFAHAIYITTVHTCAPHIATHYHYKGIQYDSVANINSQQAI